MVASGSNHLTCYLEPVKLRVLSVFSKIMFQNTKKYILYIFIEFPSYILESLKLQRVIKLINYLIFMLNDPVVIKATSTQSIGLIDSRTRRKGYE